MRTPFLLRYFRLGILAPVPPGIVADNAANFGLFALMNNANAASENLSTLLTAVPTPLTAAQVAKGVFRLTAGAGGGFILQLPTTVALLAALGPTIPIDGTFSKRVSFVNDGVGQTGTLTAGDASTTVTGTATIATNTEREFLLTVNAPAAAGAQPTITFQNLGSKAL